VVTVPLVLLNKPSIFVPTRHDTIAGSFIDQATEPLFQAIRDVRPETRSVAPLYRTPIAVNMVNRKLLMGA
jgi:hypothetical protein